LFRRGAAETPVTLKGRVRTTAAEDVREAVFAGRGLAVATDWVLAPELKEGTVRRVLEVGVSVARPMGRVPGRRAPYYQERSNLSVLRQKPL